MMRNNYRKTCSVCLPVLLGKRLPPEPLDPAPEPPRPHFATILNHAQAATSNPSLSLNQSFDPFIIFRRASAKQSHHALLNLPNTVRMLVILHRSPIHHTNDTRLRLPSLQIP